MMKTMNLMVPAALCLLCAAGLSACKDDSVPTAAKTAGSVAEVQQPSASAAATPRAATETSADGGRSSQGEATTASTVLADEPAPRAPRPEPVRREAVVTATPTVLDMGQMGTGERRTAPVTLTNTSDTAIRIRDARSSCGCTVANVPRNHDLQPGESVDVDVTLSGGQTATRLTKTVNFIFEDDHPNVTVTVSGDVVAYVTFEPRVIDPESNPDGRIVVQSHDGEPFQITAVAPQVVANIPEGAATEHELFISWDQWTELRQPRRLEISIDHPKTQRVMAAIRNPARVAQTTERARPDRPERQPARAALHEMAQRGEVDAVLARIKEGEDVDSVDPRGNSLLSVAARHGRVDLMRALIDAGADVNSVAVNDGLTPLMNAAQSKNAETVRMLLDAGADVNARDFTLGNTALSWAALNGSTETVQILLDAGATVEVVSRMTGWTPLLAAAGFGESGAVKLLLDAGSNPEVVCQVQGATPIMYAAQTGRVDNVKALLAHGVNLDTKDVRGRTALVFAAGHSGADAPTIKALIDGGADVHAVDSRGMNALDHARTRSDARRAEVVALLESYFQD